ncbi:hypothetical protein BWI96_06490 [Siphonobacter sp. SORGH_AS_0500]|uniref:thiamine phosphate synthase n=1 Tax=Siphonobacter sp. SORGH_AS_0500 TaxID=1864824 RepID=UPI000CB22CDD|nr:thiamine phosphate synthase [Siphonobacter sp. SORGH_AS_0500]PKK37507.1 hypothetical protein BWI96_06490 [Siphonobacter sp. SORGH_AS_0500]
MDSFLCVAITPDSVTDQNIIEELWSEGLDYLYWRKTDVLTQPPPIHHSNKILLASSQPTSYLWHLKEKDQQVLPVNQRAFSTSIHQLSDWPLWTNKVDLVFYSPVFESISKPGYGPVLSLTAIEYQLKKLRSEGENLPKIVALGGVHQGNIAAVQRSGFDGAALMGSLWNNENPANALRELRQQLKL